MRRDKLVWFAAGAGVCSLSFLIAQFAWSKPDQPIPYLAISDRTPELDGSAAKLVRTCDAPNFLVRTSHDIGGVALVRISKENVPYLRCILDRAREVGLVVDIEFERSRNA